MKLLNKTIQETWKNNIKNDYHKNLILNEDTMKNAIYFHLRTYFESNEDFQNLCIYTECNNYGFSSMNFRPDMIVVDQSTDKIVAIFELKYKSDECYRVEDLVRYDFDKLKKYMDTLDTVDDECQYYIAAITLGEFNRPNWLDGRSKWANGKVTELIAYGKGKEIEFNVIVHNE